MQFMNSSLEKLSKNFSDNDLAREFGSQNSMLLKWRNDYPYEYMNIFERSSDKKIKSYYYRSLKGGTTGNTGEKLNGYITDEQNLSCIKKWKMI